MAIEFNCPHCGATIRVTDTAAGKRGRCPLCSTPLLVPRIQPPPTAAPPPVAEQPLFLPLAEPAPPSAGFPLIDTQAAAPPSIARSLRRRRRRGGGWWKIGVPAVCGALLIAAVAWMLREPTPELEGTLTGEMTEQTALLSTIDRVDIDAPAEDAGRALESLAADPLELRDGSNLSVMELRGTERGLEVTVLETVASRFVRVDLRSDPAVRAWLAEHELALNQRRRRELNDALRQFLRAEAAAPQSETADDLLLYRNGVGLNALVGGLGYAVEAVTADRILRCVHEDGEGRLYFLLPEETRSFRLRGRTLPNGTRLFPGDYRVSVTAPPTPPAAEEPTETEQDTETESDGDGETEREEGQESEI